jgi:hypothetical protein
MYFIYRWVATVSVVDARTRRLLLGDIAAEVLGNPDTLQVVGAVYLGYAFLMLLVSAGGWKRYLESGRLELVHEHDAAEPTAG